MIHENIKILTGLSDGLFEGDFDGDFDGEFVGLFVGDSEGLGVGDVVGGEGGGQAPMQTTSQELSWPGTLTQEPANTVIPSGITLPVPAAPAIARCSIDSTFPAGSNVILTTVAAKRKTTPWS